jgi:MFS superfamily sulfate permease-like transporter
MRRRRRFGRDLSASFIVFLVALPLCLGIAIASGVPAERGIVCGIIGGIVAGRLAGSPLSVSGPAAGLTTLVFGIVSQHGLAALGPIVLLAGLLQVLGGLARIGAYVRFMPHCVVEAMLAAIGLILFSSQAHVMFDTAPAAGFLKNLSAAPGIFTHGNAAAGAIAALTIAVLLIWERARPVALREVPGALLGVVVATLATLILGLHVARIALPASLAGAVSLLRPSQFAEFASPSLLGAAVSVALIASIESLLSAAAVDRMMRGRRTDFSRELMAQGAGNMLCGLAGALPMTGVIVRSAANVRAGARTRMSAVLHGVWLLLLVVAAPGVLRLIPESSLAGLLVVVGVRLVNVRQLRAMWHEGAIPIITYATTLAVILATNLLSGVVVGTVVYFALQKLLKLRKEVFLF